MDWVSTSRAVYVLRVILASTLILLVALRVRNARAQPVPIAEAAPAQVTALAKVSINNTSVPRTPEQNTGKTLVLKSERISLLHGSILRLNIHNVILNHKTSES